MSTYGLPVNPTPEEAAFATYGPELGAASVPAFVRLGVTVWSFGYGDGEDGFDALDVSDLWAFEGPEADADVVASWAPFRLDMESAEHVNAHGAESDPECRLCRSTYTD